MSTGLLADIIYRKPSRLERQRPLEVIVLEGARYAVDLGRSGANRSGDIAPGRGHGGDLLDASRSAPGRLKNSSFEGRD